MRDKEQQIIEEHQRKQPEQQQLKERAKNIEREEKWRAEEKEVRNSPIINLVQ